MRIARQYVDSSHFLSFHLTLSTQTSTDILDDDAFFNSDQEEEDGLAMGTFADALGEDFLGLRELGIAQELGLSSLSVPKRLLKGKKGVPGNIQWVVFFFRMRPLLTVYFFLLLRRAKPAEAPLPYPLPPPFLPVTSKNVEDQIGLLRPYYHQRLASLTVTAPVPLGASVPGMPGVSAAPGTQGMHNLTIPGLPPLPPPPPLHFPSRLPGPGVPIPTPAALPASRFPSASSGIPLPDQPSPGPVVSLPEDPPNPSQSKLGPIGQVVKPSTASAAIKKKAKGKEGGATGAGAGGGVQAAALYPGPVLDGGIGTEGGGPSPKKKAKAVDLPPVIAASA